MENTNDSITIYAAPMEGITGNIFRTAHSKHFGGADKYFTPFISPSIKSFGSRVKQDIAPENNRGLYLVPQILTDNAKGFIDTCKRLTDYGYGEFNLNLGCPSGTVVSKGRGAGFLKRREELRQFLEEIFASGYKISVKTRLGMESPDEFYPLLEIYNDYPMEELIIHPRTRQEQYGGAPHSDMFAYAAKHSKNRLCYNGNIFTLEDYRAFKQAFPTADRVMLGRGLIINPALGNIIKNGGGELEIDRLKAFYNDLYHSYSLILSGSVPLMHKMKEFIGYMALSFKNSEKIIKKIKKSKTLKELNAAVEELWRCDF